MSRLSRRELLGGAAIIAAGTSCAPLGQTLDRMTPRIPQQTKPPFKTDMFLQDKNKHPLFRAASLTLLDRSRGATGHGCLMEDSGIYFIYTIEHVAKAMITEGSQVHIPGIGLRNITHYGFESEKETNDWEGAAYHPLSQQTTDAINRLRDQEQFTPLVLAKTPPRKDEVGVFARADLGRFSHHRIGTYNQRENSYPISADKTNLICRGASGSPLLRFTGGAPTREILGLLSRGSGLEVPNTEGAFSTCFDMGGIIRATGV